MRGRKPTTWVSEAEAAAMLGLEPAAVALFVRLRLLRPVRRSQPAFRASEVAQLQQLIDARAGRRPPPAPVRVGAQPARSA